MFAATEMNSYVLINGIGFMAAIFVLERRFRILPQPHAGRAYVLTVCSVPVGWLAAHLGDCATRGIPFSQGGFAFCWGLLGAGGFYLSIGLLILGPSALLRSINILLPVVALTHAVGRLGCFAAGCCYGCAIPHTHLRFPVQLFEAGFLTCLGIFMLRRSSDRLPSNLAIYLTAYPGFRFFIEFLRADDRGEIMGLSTSQFISLLLFVSGLLAVRFIRSEKQHAIIMTAALK